MKFPLRTREDFLKEVSDRSGYELEHIKLFEKMYWSGIRRYLNDPVRTGYRLLLKDFGAFKINKFKIWRMLKKADKLPVSEQELIKKIKSIIDEEQERVKATKYERFS